MLCRKMRSLPSPKLSSMQHIAVCRQGRNLMLIDGGNLIMEFHYKFRKHSFEDAKGFKSEKSGSNYSEKCGYTTNQIANHCK